MVKILHVAKVIQIAGAEQHLLPGLKAAGVDVRMLVMEKASHPATLFVQQFMQAGIPVDVIAAPPSASLLNSSVPSFIWQVQQYIRSQKVDIVHTHLIHADVYGSLAAHMAGVHHIISSRHNLDPFRKQPKWQLFTRILWKFNRKGIAISDAVREFVETVEHAPPGKVQTIYYGIKPWRDGQIDLSERLSARREWGISIDTPLVGSVSRLVKQKGLTYGLQAFAKVRQQVPDAHYIIAGDGELRPALEKEAKDVGLSECVHFLGWQNDIHRVLNGIDILLTPSLWEGLGMIFLEEMGHCIPIVTTRVGPMPEVVIDGVTGYLSESGSSDALAEPLARLLSDAALRERLGKAGRQRLETVFSVEQMVNKTVNLYNEAFRYG